MPWKKVDKSLHVSKVRARLMLLYVLVASLASYATTSLSLVAVVLEHQSHLLIVSSILSSAHFKKAVHAVIKVN